MNLSKLFKDAHKLCKQIRKEGDDYKVTFGACMSFIKRESFMKTLRKPCVKSCLSKAQVVNGVLYENYLFDALSSSKMESVLEFCEKTYPEFDNLPEYSVYEVDYIDVRPVYQITILMSKYGLFPLTYGTDVNGALKWTTKNSTEANRDKSAILADGFTIGSLSTDIFRVKSKAKALDMVYYLQPAGGSRNKISYMTGKAVKRHLTDEKVLAFLRQILPNFDELPETEEVQPQEVWLGGSSRFGGHFE